ncbi:hypothetical protein FE257_006476 [Aspergillus nanangensis]|uniref:CCHC-type domain-containing protein n=1 Tax=Aspergillus nanangensis TaxID=2582783 RepID=A0AAD4CZB6_ASPNN|nr:hypothetical protein FE257_006476 [Aspergillus nanangensis]
MAKNCPIPRCYSCSELGHIVRRCPYNNCDYCKENGHEARDCLQKIKCFGCGEFGHRKKDCLRKPGQEKPTDYPAAFTFPSVKDIAHQIVKAVFDSHDDEIKHIPYRTVIEACGGVDIVVDAMISSIDPDIRALEGQTVTGEVLNSIRLKQLSTPNPWPINSGYLDFVTNTTDTAYLRFYVGQAEKTILRIKLHIRNILIGLHNTLHYYVIWKGC